MVFQGDTTLQIGPTAETDERNKHRYGLGKGRLETFKVPDGEHLIGCQIFRDK
jgi:hypothetical protein